MVPLPEPRIKAKVTALQNQVDDMNVHLAALENIVKQQSAINKEQEARLAKIETNQGPSPPPYSNRPIISALTKDCQDAQVRKR